jgi:hypothetical protein
LSDRTRGITSGGHDQFYDNSTGIVWPEALKAFSVVGPAEVVTIIETSAARLGGSPSLDREERQEQLERTNADFEDLDQALFKLEQQVDFDEKVLEFIRTNRQGFFFSGVVEKS